MTGLPADVMLSLDTAVESGEMTADVHAYITLMEPDPVAWHDGLAGNDFMRLMNATARQRMAAWRETADMDDRATVTWIGFNDVPSLIKDSARHVLSEAVRLRGTDTEEVKQLLSRDDFVRDNASPFIPALGEIVMRAKDDVRIMGSAAFLEGRHLVDDLYRRIRERRMQLIAQSSDREDARGHSSRSVRKARRKPLVKALDLLAKIGGQQTASAFVSGDDIVVTGKRFNFRARKGVMSSNGHGALNITVTDKDHVELVDLCFYFENMPAPDQMAALILHVKAGNEDDIVSTGNAIRTYPAGDLHPHLLELREARKRRNEEIYGARAVGSQPTKDADPLRAAMASHIDRVLFGGIPGAANTYNRLHDDLVPAISRSIVDIAGSSRAGMFLRNVLPEVSELIRIPKPPRTEAVEIGFAPGEALAAVPLLNRPSLRTVTL